MLESQLFEGLRVVLTRPLHTIFAGPSRRVPAERRHYPLVEVPYSHSGGTRHDLMNEVPAGTKGTIYRFRIRDGRPTSGWAHPRMWGVKFDGYPTGLSGHMGICGLEHYQLAGEELPQHLALLLKDWARNEVLAEKAEAELARHYNALPDRVYTNDTIRGLHAAYKPIRDEADRLRKVYDEASNIPERQY